MYWIWHYKRKTVKLRAQAGLEPLSNVDDLPDPAVDPNYHHVLTKEEQDHLHRRSFPLYNVPSPIDNRLSRASQISTQSNLVSTSCNRYTSGKWSGVDHDTSLLMLFDQAFSIKYWLSLHEPMFDANCSLVLPYSSVF